MAISRERLEELIEQGATIWSEDWNEEVVLSKKNCEIHDIYDERNRPFMTKLFVREDNIHCPSYDIRSLTEDVGTGLWQLEFGNITRTETLNLPTWEEIKGRNLEITFCGKPKINDYFDAIWHTYDGRFRLNCCVEEKYISIYDDLPCEDYFDSPKKFPYTKDGYLSACRLAKKLFLGEK